jgi:hypothetical protein
MQLSGWVLASHVQVPGLHPYHYQKIKKPLRNCENNVYVKDSVKYKSNLYELNLIIVVIFTLIFLFIYLLYLEKYT